MRLFALYFTILSYSLLMVLLSLYFRIHPPVTFDFHGIPVDVYRDYTDGFFVHMGWGIALLVGVALVAIVDNRWSGIDEQTELAKVFE